jgi:hypothetical protein
MTHAVTIVKKGVFGDLQYRMVKVDITAHVVNGIVLTPTSVALGSIVWIDVPGATESGYAVRWNGATGAATCKIQCLMGNYDDTGDGPLIDAATADVGEVYITVYGYL